LPVTARFLVSGLVQGVGYRAFARRTALDLGLVGYAKNLPDGRVETVVTGPPDAIAEYTVALSRGPSFSQVTSVDRTEISDQLTSFKQFEIK
jgi:acylphosphatase